MVTLEQFKQTIADKIYNKSGQKFDINAPIFSSLLEAEYEMLQPLQKSIDALKKEINYGKK